jgi:hypothetical protein
MPPARADTHARRGREQLSGVVSLATQRQAVDKMDERLREKK